MKPKNLLFIVLMATSVLLLLVLQFFWLTSSYEKAYLDLRKDTNTLFESTIGTLRDSLLIKNFERIPTDTTSDARGVFINTGADTSFNLNESPKKKGRRNATQIQIFISSTNKKDSLQTFLKPIGSQLQKAKIETGSFVFRVGPDSLSREVIHVAFQKSLAKENLTFPFEIGRRSAPDVDQLLGTPRAKIKAIFGKEYADEETNKLFSDTIKSRWVRFNPIHMYNVQLTNGRRYILKGITPQILFSLFLTTLTLGAFWIMYRSIRTQQRLGELKNDFISNMTHELKTPITTVGVAIEALRDFNGIDNRQMTKEYLDIAQNELQRLSLLTDKILKTSLFESKGVDFQPERVELDRVIEQVVASLRLVLEKKNANITFEKIGSHFEMQGSLVHLTNVIYNLLDNALKYSIENPAIKIILRETGKEIELNVEDNGIGISSDYQKKVFEKFFRVPAGDVHTTKGYGLGLSYVDSVVKAHKATIALKSEIGKGSTFTISFKK